jgi:HK97 family phage prohead protease
MEIENIGGRNLVEKIVKSFKSLIKSINEEEYTADVIVSTDGVDRDREKIAKEAFTKRLKYYKDHPVLLSSHQYGDLRKQIGEASKIKMTDEGLVATFKYYTNSGNPEADWAWVLAQKGIAGFSIGFIPFAYADKDLEKDGYNREYTDVELVEISQVLVPSNRNAVQQRRDIVKNLNAVEQELLDIAIKQFEDGTLRERERDTTEQLEQERLAVEKQLTEKIQKIVSDSISANIETITQKVIEKLKADEMFLKSLRDGMAKTAGIPIRATVEGMIKSALQPKESK